MSIGAIGATQAYGRALDIGRGATAAPAVGKPAAGGFGGMVQSLIGDAATSMRSAEQASAKQIAGKGDLIDVVTAMGAAETALDTVVAVRDRVVSAYTDIMRLQI